MATAFVLSGGGTRGDFEVGAVKFLYEAGIRPDIICSTSVGSVNAIKLAEGEGTATQGLAGLLDIWQNQIKSFGDIFSWEDWLNRIDPGIANALQSILLGDFSLPSSSGSGSSGTNGQWGDLGALWQALSEAYKLAKKAPDEVKSILALASALPELEQAKGLINLTPLQRLLEQHVQEPLVAKWAAAAPGHALRVAMVSLDTGRLRFMTETGMLLEEDLKTAVLVHPDAPDPCASLKTALNSLVQSRNDAIAQDIHDGIKPSKDPEVLALNREIQQVRQQLEKCLAAHASPSPTLVPAQISLVDGAMASSLQPVFMPAISLFGDWYVDAGIRSVLPVKAALDQGATTVWAIEAAPRGLSPWSSQPTIPAVAERAIQGILLDAVTVSDEQAAVGHDVKLIFPRVNIHESFQIDSGLIQISLDYGFMRAADVFHKTSEQIQALADRITTIRSDTWRLEQFCLTLDPGVPPDEVRAALADIRFGKRRYARLIHARELLGGQIAGFDSLTLPWEKHAYTTLSPATPWDTFAWEAGQSVPAMNQWAADSPAAPVVTSPGSTQLDTFVVGTDGMMYHQAWDGGQPSFQWEPLGELVHPLYASAPAAVKWPDGRLDAFVVGGDHVLYHKPWRGGLQFGWEPVGGVWCSGNPVAVLGGTNRLDLFARGPASELFHNTYDGASWAGWESLGGSCITPPAVASWGSNRLDVFVLGDDEQLYHKWWDGARWGPSPTDWEPLGGVLVSAPAVTSWGSNRLDIFGIGTDGQLYHKWWDGARWGPSPTDWEPLGGFCTSLPAVTSWGSNRLDVFVIGTDGQMYHKFWNGSMWGPSPTDWEPLGGIFSSSPTVTSWGNNRLDIFGVGIDHQLYHKSFAGAWRPSATGWDALRKQVVTEPPATPTIQANQAKDELAATLIIPSPLVGLKGQLQLPSGKVIPLLTQQVVIGRGATDTSEVAAIDLSSEQEAATVSRSQAQITQVGDHYEIEDLKSSNGTILNNLKLSPGQRYLLHPGESIEFGKVHCVFSLG